MLVNGLRREYLLFPSERKVSPLVLFLHGTGATASWANQETGWSQLAARAGFTLALPDAMSANPDHPPRFLTNPQLWNDGCPTSPSTGASTDDVSFLARVIDDVQSRLGIDAKRVYLSGFSNGAAMAFRDASDVPSPAAWHWEFGDGETSDEANPVHTYLIPGVYDVRLTVTGAAGPAARQKAAFVTVGPAGRGGVLGEPRLRPTPRALPPR